LIPTFPEILQKFVFRYVHPTEIITSQNLILYNFKNRSRRWKFQLNHYCKTNWHQLFLWILKEFYLKIHTSKSRPYFQKENGAFSLSSKIGSPLASSVWSLNLILGNGFTDKIMRVQGNNIMRCSDELPSNSSWTTKKHGVFCEHL